jgi:hypothetical protein
MMISKIELNKFGVGTLYVFKVGIIRFKNY